MTDKNNSTEIEGLKSELAKEKKKNHAAIKRLSDLKAKIKKNESTIGKSLPFDDVSEKAVLSCCIDNAAKAIPVVRKRLADRGSHKGGEAFYNPCNKAIWDSLVKLYEEHGDFSLNLVLSEMTNSPILDELGGISYVSEVATERIPYTWLDQYLSRVSENWFRRLMWRASQELQKQSAEGDIGEGIFKAFDQVELLRGRMLDLSASSSDETAIIALIDEIPNSETIWLVRNDESVKALKEIGLYAIAPYDLKVSGTLRESFRGRIVIGVKEIDQESTAEENFVRRIFSITKILTLIPLKKFYPSISPCSIGKLIEECKRLLQPIEFIRQQIVTLADESRVPFSLAMENIYEYGERGGVVINQNELADRLVRYHDLLHAGDFWSWQSSGYYKNVETTEEIDSYIRYGLCESEATELSISSPLVDSVKSLMRSSNFCHPNQLNCSENSYLVNCASGMFNILTGDIMPHHRRYKSTTQVPIIWNNDAECPRFLEWLEEMKPEEDERAQIQEMFGYCLVPDITYHVFFFLHGGGGTGKSTLVDILVAIIGDENVLGVQLEELSNPFTRSKLVGKQIYLCGEITTKSFKHIGLIKQIAASEPIYCDVKHRDGYTFRPKGRFIMTSNVVAHTPDTSTGFERRFLQINFENAIPREKQDFNLKEKFMAELPGIFRWSVEGFRRLQKRGHFEHTEGNKEAIRNLMRHRSQVKSFTEEADWMVWDTNERGPGGNVLWCEPEQIHKRYIEWCEFWGVKPFAVEVTPFIRELYRVMPAVKDKAQRCKPPGGGDRCRWFKGMYVPELIERDIV